MRDRMNDCSEVPLTGAMRRTRGSIGGMAVDLVVSGIGTVYGTLATTAAILDRKPIAVLSCGCSGAHVRDLRMGDVVLASEVVPLDAIVLERGGKVRRTGVRRSMQDPQVQSWHADTTLLQHAKVAADQVARRRTASGGRALTYMTGAVGSSDTWRQSPQVIEQIHSETQSLCEEMEAGAVAQARGPACRPQLAPCAGRTRAWATHVATAPVLGPVSCPAPPSAGGALVRRALFGDQGHCQQRAQPGAAAAGARAHARQRVLGRAARPRRRRGHRRSHRDVCGGVSRSAHVPCRRRGAVGGHTANASVPFRGDGLPARQIRRGRDRAI